MKNNVGTCNCRQKPCGCELQISRLMQSTCKAHEKLCEHMVIAHENFNMCKNVSLVNRSQGLTLPSTCAPPVTIVDLWPTRVHSTLLDVNINT